MDRDAFTSAMWALAIGIAGWGDAQRGAWLGVATIALAPLALRLLVIDAGRRQAAPGGPSAREIEGLAWPGVGD